MAEELKFKAKNLLHAGVNLIQQVGLFKAADSSDDERVDAQDADDFINNGGRGILTFPVTSLRTGKQKVLHLHLYKQKVMQYHDGKKRVYACSEIISIDKETPSQVALEMKHPIDVKIRMKRLLFDSEGAADRFSNHVEFLNEFGKVVKAAFNQIDYARSGRISRDDLAIALRRIDLRVDDDSIDKMVACACLSGGGDTLDYSAFMSLFLNSFSFVSSLRDCLQDWLTLATSAVESTASAKTANLVQLPGEIVAFTPRDRVHFTTTLTPLSGKPSKHLQRYFPALLHVTNYRVVMVCLRRPSVAIHTRFDMPAFFQQLTVPLGSIAKIYVAAPRMSVYLQCKDHRLVRITLSTAEATKQKVDAFMSLLQSLTFQQPYNLFAYRFALFPDCPPPGPGGGQRLTRGWTFSDVTRDYERLDLTNDADWQLFHNEDYLCVDTYPKHFLVPRDMTRSQILAAAQYRSRGRLPVIIYRTHPDGALLLRSAQPMAGLTQKICEEELRLLEHYRMRGALQPPGSPAYDHNHLCILDCRGIIAATLNKAAGKGTENAAVYTQTEVVFGNVDNIHVMRSAAAAYSDALLGGMQPCLDTRDQLDVSLAGYLHKLEESGWQRHLRAILVCAAFVAEQLHCEERSVLVHCSDGWDRTPQVTSLSQLLLDPFYRTVPGLATLVEKDWCAFGHKFQDRLGHGSDPSLLPDERSPVFLQFLECVFVLTRQFPSAFQFNEELLLFLADHSTSCLFGTFLGNNERERHAQLQAPQCTVSIWDYVLDETRLLRFLNPVYAPHPHPLWPRTAGHALPTWERYWLRWDPAAHPSPLDPLAKPWHDDWGCGPETRDRDNGTGAGVTASASGPPPPPPPVAPRTPLTASPSVGSAKLSLRPPYTAAADPMSDLSASGKLRPSGSCPTPPLKPERRRRDPPAPVTVSEPAAAILPLPQSSPMRAGHGNHAASASTSPAPRQRIAPSPPSKSLVQGELQAVLLRRLQSHSDKL